MNKVELAKRLFGTDISDGATCASCGIKVVPATDFRDEISKREWGISFLCQQCQDKTFGSPDD